MLYVGMEVLLRPGQLHDGEWHPVGRVTYVRPQTVDPKRRIALNKLTQTLALPCKLFDFLEVRVPDFTQDCS